MEICLNSFFSQNMKIWNSITKNIKNTQLQKKKQSRTIELSINHRYVVPAIVRISVCFHLFYFICRQTIVFYSFSPVC